MAERWHCYWKSWGQVRFEYMCGRIASERNIQAILYCALRECLPENVHIVIEPTWDVGGNNRSPDMVLVEDGVITDIFDWKFSGMGHSPGVAGTLRLREQLRQRDNDSDNTG